MLNENNMVSKSKTIIDLKNLDLNLQELKVLDVYLSKINPKNMDTAKVRFTKKEYCELISVNPNWLKTKRLSKYLQHLFNNSVVEWLDDEQESFKLHHLFEEAEYDKKNSTITLECGKSDYVRSMFFNINACGYIKYALKNTLYLKSTYSIRLYLYCLQNRFRKQWKITLEEFKENVLEVSDIETYSQYKFLNAYILKPSIKEINEKTNLEIKYSSIKKGNKIHTLEFTCHFKDSEDVINGDYKEISNSDIENPYPRYSDDYMIWEVEQRFQKKMGKAEKKIIREYCELYDPRRVICALNEAVCYEKLNLYYVETILKTWIKKGFSVEEIENGMR